MVGGISIGGLGSGLDTGAIIDALMDVERIPLNQLEARKKEEQQKLSLIGTFKGHVEALRDKAEQLSTLSGFLSFQVVPSLEGFATFAASSGAVAGTHTLEVQQLASADRWAFDPVADASAPLSLVDGDSISFDYDGVSYTVPLTQATSSLNAIAAEISTAVGGELDVNVVNTGPASNPSYQLVLGATQTGEDFRITNLTSSVPGLTIDGSAGSQNNVTVGENARAIVDGLQVERSDNDFSGVVPGVSITLTKADPGNPITFTVDPDKEAIKEGLTEFVDAYNEVISFINAQNTYDEEAGPGGLLFGDGILSSIQRATERIIYGQSLADVQADVTGYGTLRLVGIEGQSDGTLSVDETVLDAKLDADFTAFAELFVDSDGFDNGGALPGQPGYYDDRSLDTGLADDLMRELDKLIDDYVDASGNSYDGLFSARTESLNSTIKDFDKQIQDREFRLDQYEANLIARFSALESLMAQLNSQLSYLQNLNPA